MSLYFDYNASSPCDPRVLEKMIPFFTEEYANPGSTVHSAGRHVLSAIESARLEVSNLINAFPAEIIFTSGATESNNLAILGTARAHTGRRRRILTSSIEHKSILALERPLKKEGFILDIIPVDQYGCINFDELVSKLDEDVLLVSIQSANNEIGTLQPIGKIADATHRVGAYIHTDATQIIGKLPVDVALWDIDLLSFSSHKFYGPKGIGALFVSGGASEYPIEPLIYGGGQEWSLRSGTHNVPSIIGMGFAAQLAAEEMKSETQRLERLRDELESDLKSSLENIHFNGNSSQRLPHCLSVTFPGIDSEVLIAQLQAFALSNGAACQSSALEPSHVLTSIGLSREEAYSTLRISVGRNTSHNDLQLLSKELIESVKKMRM